MKSRLLAPLVALIIAAWIGSGWALTALEIAKKSLELDRSPTKVTTYKMIVTNKKGQTRTYRFTSHEKQYPEGSKKIIRFLEPADAKGTGLLSFERKTADDLQWLFLPSQKKARQLAASNKSDEFMGSDLWMEDMATQTAEKFNHEMLQQVMLDGVQCYLVESKPKPGVNSAYSKTRSWINTSNFVALKMELYDKKGALIKTINNKKAEQISGFWTITNVQVVTQDKGKAMTEVQIEKREYNVDIPDRFFTQQYLESY